MKEKFDTSDLKFCGFEWFFEEHLETVVKLSKELQEKYGGNKQVIVAAAYLHDIGLTEGGFENHEERSAEMSQKILKGMNFTAEDIEQVKLAILATEKGNFKTLEGRIVMTADAMAHFLSNQFLVKAFLTDDFNKFSEWFGKKISTCFEKIGFLDEKEKLRPLFERFLLMREQYENKRNT